MDNDPQAVEVARQNSAINDVSERLEFYTGSLSEIKAGAFSMQKCTFGDGEYSGAGNHQDAGCGFR